MEEIVLVDGVWDYEEEFDYGKSSGKIFFTQTGNALKGKAVLTETDSDGQTIVIEEIIEGEVRGSKVIFYGISFQSNDLKSDQTYNLDNWEGLYTQEKKIVGHTYDQDQICGVFVMTLLLR
ncbi:MAG: hypothetical protein JEZ03_09525 [Bacteroidales bacterium]|nr:hypothetical protein [Bacteroidales bacterium]